MFVDGNLLNVHWLELHKERSDRNILPLQPSSILSRTFVVRFLDKLLETLLSENIPFMRCKNRLIRKVEKTFYLQQPLCWGEVAIKIVQCDSTCLQRDYFKATQQNSPQI